MLGPDYLNDSIIVKIQFSKKLSISAFKYLEHSTIITINNLKIDVHLMFDPEHALINSGLLYSGLGEFHMSSIIELVLKRSLMFN